jgi:hypothetical protein
MLAVFEARLPSENVAHIGERLLKGWMPREDIKEESQEC